LINDIRERKDIFLNASIYVDYENIFKRLQTYGKTPTQIKFFESINKRLKEEYKLNVIDNLVYCNFEKTEFFNSNHQTQLQSLGLQTRHTSNNGKNSADLEMTVDALKTLYKNDKIDVFILISCDRDLIPLIKAIKSENKIAFVLSTKIGFNKIVAEYADFHEFIEDFFDLNEVIPVVSEHEILESANNIKVEDLTSENIEYAVKVSQLLYSSNKWDNRETEPITLNGYSSLISHKLSKLKDDVIEYFQHAHFLMYIDIYYDKDKRELCLSEGQNSQEILEK